MRGQDRLIQSPYKAIGTVGLLIKFTIKPAYCVLVITSQYHGRSVLSMLYDVDAKFFRQRLPIVAMWCYQVESHKKFVRVAALPHEFLTIVRSNRGLSLQGPPFGLIVYRPAGGAGKVKKQ